MEGEKMEGGMLGSSEVGENWKETDRLADKIKNVRDLEVYKTAFAAA